MKKTKDEDGKAQQEKPVAAETARAGESARAGTGGPVASRESGLVRTFLVFVDAPVHIEYRACPMPLLHRGTEIDFDIVLMSPSDPKRRRRHVTGAYVVQVARLKYSSGVAGLSQYLELAPVREK